MVRLVTVGKLFWVAVRQTFFNTFLYHLTITIWLPNIFGSNIVIILVTHCYQNLPNDSFIVRCCLSLNHIKRKMTLPTYGQSLYCCQTILGCSAQEFFLYFFIPFCYGYMVTKFFESNIVIIVVAHCYQGVPDDSFIFRCYFAGLLTLMQAILGLLTNFCLQCMMTVGNTFQSPF